MERKSRRPGSLYRLRINLFVTLTLEPEPYSLHIQEAAMEISRHQQTGARQQQQLLHLQKEVEPDSTYREHILNTEKTHSKYRENTVYI